MILKWVDDRSVLAHGGKIYKAGATVPAAILSSERVAYLKRNKKLREYASESEYKSSLPATKKRSTQYLAVQSQKIADIMETKALPDIAEPPIAEPEVPKAKRGRKAGPKADTIENPPVDDGGINNEDGTDENGADE